MNQGPNLGTLCMREGEVRMGSGERRVPGDGREAGRASLNSGSLAALEFPGRLVQRNIIRSVQ